MSFRLTICPIQDSKLLENFPHDPYSDVEVLTTSHRLELSMAYLTIDSHYFAKIPPGTHTIDLTHLPEQPLLHVLQALYGGDLECTSIPQLAQLYNIIGQLEIEEYKTRVQRAMLSLIQQKGESALFSSIEVTDFCLEYGVCRSEALQFHLGGGLKVFESSKNYLQLGKVSDQSLNTLLLAFIDARRQTGHTVVNHILENYFNRKSYRPSQYFGRYPIAVLENIWEKYHQKTPMRFARPLEKTVSATDLKDFNTYKSQITAQKQLTNLRSTNIASQIFTTSRASEENKLDYRLQTLMKELDLKNKHIESLRNELKELLLLKEERDRKQEGISDSLDDDRFFTHARLRKSRETAYARMGGDSSTQQTELGFYPIKKATEEGDMRIKLVGKNSGKKGN